MLDAADIRKFSLFAGLEQVELEAIAALGTRKKFEPGEIIFSKDACTTDVYLLEEGNESVQMEIQGKNSAQPVIVHTIDRGELFSWDPLCPPRPRATTARVVQPATVIIIDGEGLKKLLDQNEHMGCIVMRNLSAVISGRLSYITLVLGSEVFKFRKIMPPAAAEKKKSLASRLPFGAKR